jgi:UDP-2-acetamido-3-amino-2,3-dideoxy-glucuronate N-acetyltransferase
MTKTQDTKGYFAHETAVVDAPSEIGAGTKIWHFSHVMRDTKIGARCNIGQNVVISPQCVVGDNVKIQNNVSVYTGVILEDDVFCGPSMVFTNVINRAATSSARTSTAHARETGRVDRRQCHDRLRRHAGRYCVRRRRRRRHARRPDYAVVYGNPARVRSWVCWCGVGLELGGDDGACARPPARPAAASTGARGAMSPEPLSAVRAPRCRPDAGGRRAPAVVKLAPGQPLR